MGGFDNGRDIKGLAGVVVDAAQKHQGWALARNGSDDVLCVQEVVPGTRAQSDNRVVGVEAVKSRLRGDGVLVRRKGRRLHQNLVAQLGGPIKAHHHQMKVHREGVHHHDFARLGSHQSRRVLGKVFVIGQPRPLRLYVTFDTMLGPVTQFLVDVGAGFFRLQS